MPALPSCVPAGFDVIVLPVTEEDPSLAVESTGRELHPASVLLVERLAKSSDDADGATELWLADRMLRKTVVLRLKPEARDTVGTETASSREAARVAVQAVELVKALAKAYAAEDIAIPVSLRAINLIPEGPSTPPSKPTPDPR